MNGRRPGRGDQATFSRASGLAGAAESPGDEELQREQTRRRIDEVLETLNPRYAKVLRLRLLEDRDQGQTPVGRGWSYDVFSGAETWTIAVTLVTREVIDTELLGPVPTRVLALHTRHEGMLEQKGRFRLWLTDDARRIPVKMEVRTNFGTIRGALTNYEPPPSWSVAAAASD